MEFGFHLAKYFSSSIDSSDGLSSSLYELAQKSNKVDMLVNKIPTPKELCHFANLNAISIENLLFSVEKNTRQLQQFTNQILRK